MQIWAQKFLRKKNYKIYYTKKGRIFSPIQIVKRKILNIEILIMTFDLFTHLIAHDIIIRVRDVLDVNWNVMILMHRCHLCLILSNRNPWNVLTLIIVTVTWGIIHGKISTYIYWLPHDENFPHINCSVTSQSFHSVFSQSLVISSHAK